MRSPLLKAWLFALSSITGLAAQQQPTSQDEPIRTLHVYTDLVQVPTLVLGRNHELISPPIAEQRFSVSIDFGPWFRVTHTRMEGTDPISLSILLDTGGAAADLLPKIDDAIAALAPSSLTSRDRVSIYVLDCALTRSLNDTPAGSAQLKLGADSALEPWTIHKQDRRHPCKQSVHLWDALGYVATELSKLPGRRVMLVVSDGHDGGSVRTWNEVRSYTQAAGVAVFGMMNTAITPGWSNILWAHHNDANAFQTICELSGGMLMLTTPDSIGNTLAQSIALLRGRYIVEFPRPRNSTKGEHDMRIKIAKAGNDFIRPSGISVPMPDPAVLADPTTVPSDPSHAPEQGQRHVMAKPQK
jgi:hypothetical protein